MLDTEIPSLFPSLFSSFFPTLFSSSRTLYYPPPQWEFTTLYTPEVGHVCVPQGRPLGVSLWGRQGQQRRGQLWQRVSGRGRGRRRRLWGNIRNVLLTASGAQSTSMLQSCRKHERFFYDSLASGTRMSESATLTTAVQRGHRLYNLQLSCHVGTCLFVMIVQKWPFNPGAVLGKGIENITYLNLTLFKRNLLFFFYSLLTDFQPGFRIYLILTWIRILGSTFGCSGFGSGSRSPEWIRIRVPIFW